MGSLEIRRLAGHMGWADALMWRAVLENEAARRDDRTRELLHHIHEVQWVYLRIWRGEPLREEPLAMFERIEAIADWGRRFHFEAAPVLGAMSESDLAETVDFPWRDMLLRQYGALHPTDLRDSVLQIVQHTMHHRGQVAIRLREVGGEPPLTDFIVWCWSGRPAMQWPVLGTVREVE